MLVKWIFRLGSHTTAASWQRNYANIGPHEFTGETAISQANSCSHLQPCTGVVPAAGACEPYLKGELGPLRWWLELENLI